MIKSITKKVTGDNLEVTVHTKMNDFAIQPIKILEESHLKNILSREYKILETIKRPPEPVGNSIRRGIKQSGVWVFKIELEKQNVPKVQKPPAEKSKPIKPRTRRSPAKKSSTNSSIRAKMKTIAEQSQNNRKTNNDRNKKD